MYLNHRKIAITEFTILKFLTGLKTKQTDKTEQNQESDIKQEYALH